MAESQPAAAAQTPPLRDEQRQFPDELGARPHDAQSEFGSGALGPSRTANNDAGSGHDAAASATAALEPPSLGALLAWLGRHGRGGHVLLSAAAALLVVASQVPQTAAPLWTSDGLGRADLMLFEALGLTRLGGSLLVWLFPAIAIVLLLAEASQARAPGAIDAVVVAAVRARLGAAWDALPTRARRDHIVIGRAVWARGLMAIAAALYLAAWIASAQMAAPLELDVDVRGLEAVRYERLEAGRRVQVPGPVRRCVTQDASLRCTRTDPQGRALVPPTEGAAAHAGEHTTTELRLEAGEPLTVGAEIWTWTAVGASPSAAGGRFEWAQPSGGWVGFEVAADRATIVPSLGARVAVVGTRASGPLAAIAQGGPGGMHVGLVAGPALATGAGVARLRSAGRARIRVEPALPSTLATLALLSACLAVILYVALPVAIVVRDPAARGGFALAFVNRASARARWTRAEHGDA